MPHTVNISARMENHFPFKTGIFALLGSYFSKPCDKEMACRHQCFLCCKLREQDKPSPVKSFNYKEKPTVTNQEQLHIGSNSDRLLP